MPQWEKKYILLGIGNPLLIRSNQRYINKVAHKKTECTVTIRYTYTTTGFVRGITKSYKVLYLFSKNKTSYKVLYFF